MHTSFHQMPRGQETASNGVNLSAFLGGVKRHAQESQAQPDLDACKGAILEDLRDGFEEVSERGELMELAAIGYFRGFKGVAPLSSGAIEVFANAPYDDIIGGSDITACFTDSDQKIHAASIDVTSDSRGLSKKLRRQYIGDGVGNVSDRRLVPPLEKRGIFIPESLDLGGENELDFASVWVDGRNNALADALPLVGCIDDELLCDYLDIPKQALEDSRDLFGLQLLFQARAIQGIITRWTDGSVRDLGDGFTSAMLFHRLQNTHDSAIAARGFSWEQVPAIRATGYAAHAVARALFASLYGRYPALKPFFEMLDTAPSDVFTDSRAIRSAIQIIGPHTLLEATREGTERLISQLLPFILASIDRPPIMGGNTFRDASITDSRRYSVGSSAHRA